MQSTGQTSMQESSLMQLLAMTYVMTPTGYKPGKPGRISRNRHGTRSCYHEAVGAQLGAPYLAVAAEQLADVGSLLRQPERFEALAGGIETHQRVGAEVGEPWRVRARAHGGDRGEVMVSRAASEV